MHADTRTWHYVMVVNSTFWKKKGTYPYDGRICDGSGNTDSLFQCEFIFLNNSKNIV